MFILSNRCLACNKPICSKNKILICNSCYLLLNWSDFKLQNLCSCCGEEIPGNFIKQNKDNKKVSHHKILCGKCISNPFAFDQMHFVMQYDLITGFLLKSYKFNKKFCYARLLIKLIQIWIIRQENLFNKNNYNIDVIIPMPLHRVKLITRGFNQSICFAKFLSKQLNVKLSLNIIKKIKNTNSQARLNAQKRKQNLVGSFKVDIKKLKNAKRVLIVDDVMTTGSSAHVLARSLKQAGVKWVGVFVLLRAI